MFFRKKSAEQIANGVAFFAEFVDSGIDFFLAEGAEFDTLDDFEFAAVGADREGADESFFDAVATVGGDGDTVPVALACGGDDGLHAFDGGVGSGFCRGETASFDNGCAALLHGGDEVAFEPGGIADDFACEFTGDPCVCKIWVEGAGVVAPDSEIADVAPVGAGFEGELGFCTVFVEASHSKPAVCGNVAGVIHRDEAIRIAGISDDEGANVRSSIFLNGLALGDKNFAVDVEKVFAFHAGFARDTADQEGPVCSAEADVEIIGGSDFFQERKGTVLEFHHDSFECLHTLRNFNEVQIDGLIRSEDGSGCDAGKEGVADLSGGSCDGDCDRCFHKIFIL